MAKKTTTKKSSAPATKKTPATTKKMPAVATKTKQGTTITKGELTLTVQGKKKVLKVYSITIKGTKFYAIRRGLAPINNAKYLPLAKFEAARSEPRKTKKKKAVVAVELSVDAMALVPIVAKLQRGEIRLLAAEALKYKRVNAKQIKAQVKADKLKAKRDALQKQIEALEATGK